MKLNRRKMLGVTAAATATALMLSGSTYAQDLAPGQTVTQAEIDAALQVPTTLTVWSWASFIKPGIAEFMKRYPAITVDLVNVGVGQDQYTKLSNATMSGTGAPDLAMVDYGIIPEFVMSDALLDLTPFGAAGNEEDYTEGAWNYVNIAGKVVGVPQNTNPLVFFYRDDVFKEAGVTEPTTWDEFLAAGKTIKEKTGSAIVNLDPAAATTTFGLLSQAGVVPFTYDGVQTVTVNLSSPEVKKVADLMTVLIQSGVAETDPSQTDDWYQSLAKKKYVGWLNGVAGQNNLLNTLTDQSGLWRVAQLPKWPGEPVRNGSTGSATVIMKTTKNPLAAYAFSQFMFHNTEIVTMGAGRAFPALREVLSSPAFIGATNPYFGDQPTNKIYFEAAENVTADFEYLPFTSVVISTYISTVGAAMTNRQDLFPAFLEWEKQVKDFAMQQGFTVN